MADDVLPLLGEGALVARPSPREVLERFTAAALSNQMTAAIVIAPVGRARSLPLVGACERETLLEPTPSVTVASERERGVRHQEQALACQAAEGMGIGSLVPGLLPPLVSLALAIE